jgi:hypothetical protein
MSCKYHLFRVLDGDDYSVDPDGDAGALVEVVLCRHLEKYRTMNKKSTQFPVRHEVFLFYFINSTRVGMFLKTFATGLRLRLWILSRCWIQIRMLELRFHVERRSLESYSNISFSKSCKSGFIESGSGISSEPGSGYGSRVLMTKN